VAEITPNILNKNCLGKYSCI